MPSPFGAPFDRGLCTCTAELPVCLHEERPGCVCAGRKGSCPALHSQGGGQSQEGGASSCRREADGLRRGWWWRARRCIL